MDNIISNDGSGSNGNGNGNSNVNAMAANQTSLFLCNNKMDGSESSAGEVNGRRVVDTLTPSQLSEKRKGFIISGHLCRVVNNSSQKIGEFEDYSTDEKKEVDIILKNYFPYGHYIAKTESRSKATNPRPKQLEFLRKYGCANAKNTGCNCMLFIARVKGAILVYERVDEKGVPFEHSPRHILQNKQPITADAVGKSDESTMSAISSTNDSSASTATQLPTRKNPNPFGTPTGDLRRAKNQKLSGLSNAGDTTDLIPSKSEEKDVVHGNSEEGDLLGGAEVPSVARMSIEDDVLLKLFQGEVNVTSVQPCGIQIAEGTKLSSPTQESCSNL